MADNPGAPPARPYTDPASVQLGRQRPAVCLPPGETLIAVYLRDLLGEVRRIVGEQRARDGGQVEIVLKAKGASLKRVRLHVPAGAGMVGIEVLRETP